MAIQLALLPCLSAVVLAGDWNGTRAVAPLLVLSMVTLAVPAQREVATEPVSPLPAVPA